MLVDALGVSHGDPLFGGLSDPSLCIYCQGLSLGFRRRGNVRKELGLLPLERKAEGVRRGPGDPHLLRVGL